MTTQKAVKAFDTVVHSLLLQAVPNRHLTDLLLDKVYPACGFDLKGAIMDEVIDRLDNEDDIMRRELTRGIL